VTAPPIVPVVAGLNVTVTVHAVHTARLVPHGVVPPGVAVYWPLATIPFMERAVLCVLMIVMV